MSADRNFYDSKRRLFGFDGQTGFNGSIVVHEGVAYVQEPVDSDAKYYKLSPKVIGKIIATALIDGATKVHFDSVTVSVNYLVQMLGFVGKNGWFYDVLSSTEDHAFDPNHPTPGYFVGEAQQLQEQAAELEKYARLARSAHRTDEAKDADSRATQLRATARRMLTQQ